MICSGGTHRLQALPTELVLGRRVPVAQRGLSRLLGLALLELDAAGPGLLIPGCRSIHSFGMRFPLTVFFLDGNGRIVASRDHLPPGRFATCRRAAAVLEIPCDSQSRVHGTAPGGRESRLP